MVLGVGTRRDNLLIGRDEELSRLRAALDDARSGQGAMFLVSGEAGIGKTSLLEALADGVGRTEAPMFWGRCWESGGAPAYWPWVQVLRSLAHLRPDGVKGLLDPTVASLLQLDPQSGSHSSGAASASMSGSPDPRLQLFDSVAVLLESVASDRGTLIVALDDLHAADEASMRLLDFVARRLSGSHLLIVGTFRDAEVAASPERQRLLSRIAGYAEPLPLVGLDEAGVFSVWEQITGALPVGLSAQQVQQVTDGNPFFVKEVARLAATGRWRGARVPIPEEVSSVIRQRLQELDGRTRRILTFGSVFGREFDGSALSQLSAESCASLLDVLHDAGKRGVLVEVGLQRWSFSHALIREALYDDIPPSERGSLHRRAGDVVEALYGGDLVPHLAALAHHFFEARADTGSKAVKYCTMAADRAMASLAYEDAAVLYGRALDVLSDSPPVDEAHRHDLLMAIAEARTACGDMGGAQVACRRALKCARVLGSADRLARAAYGLAATEWSDDLTDILEEAAKALPQTDSAIRARILVMLAYVRYFDRPSEWRELHEMGREAAEVAQRAGDPSALRDVLARRHHFTDPRAVGERLTIADELIRLSRDVGNAFDLGHARYLRMRALFEAGAIEALSSELDIATREADEARISVLRWSVLIPRVWLSLLEGDADRAEEIAERMLSIGERCDYGDVQGLFQAQLSNIRMQQGRLQDLEEIARLAGERAFGTPPKIHCCRVDLAVALAEQGRVDEARLELDIMVPDGLGPESYGQPRTCCLTGLADVSWALWDPASAAPIYEALLPYAGLHGWTNLAFVASAGSIDRSLARLATLQRRWDEAEAFFDSAHELHERLGARAFAAHTDDDHARMLLARRAPGDEARAVELLTSARDRYGSLGMTFYQRRVEALLGPLGRDDRLAERGTIRQEGDYWSVGFAGSVVRIRDGKGVRYLVRLLADPGREVHAVELVAGSTAGPDRHGAPDAELARQSVTRGVKATIDRLGQMSPALGAHLRNSVRTGMYSSYVPDRRAPVTWEDQAHR